MGPNANAFSSAKVIDANMVEGAAYLGSWVFKTQDTPIFGNPGSAVFVSDPRSIWKGSYSRSRSIKVDQQCRERMRAQKVKAAKNDKFTGQILIGLRFCNRGAFLTQFRSEVQ